LGFALPLLTYSFASNGLPAGRCAPALGKKQVKATFAYQHRQAKVAHQLHKVWWWSCLKNVSSDYPRLLPIGTRVAQAEVRSTRDICIGHDYYSG
jgi:hypothetical protein